MSTAKKALTGTLFVAANSYLSLFIFFISGIFLARLLNPVDFGIYRLSLFFVDLFGRFKEFGLDKALIHRQEDLDKAYRAHFTLQVSLSLITFVIVLVFSPLILGRYPNSVFPFMVLISLSYIFQSVGSTQKIYFEKSLRFKQTALVDLIALFLSSVLSVYLAFRGYGPLSLVVGYGSNFIMATVMYWIIRPWRPSLSGLFIFEFDQIKWFLRFGFFLFLGGVTTFIIFKYNDFILGTFLSVAALGFYSRAFNYAQIPTSLITSVVSRVALPVYSRLQNEKEKLTEAFTIVLKSIVRFSFPLSLVLYLVADDFTVFVLGNKWSPMVPIFRILLIYGVFRSIFDDLGELFTAVGKPKYVSIYLLAQALVSLALAPILTNLYKASGAAMSLSLVLALGVIVAYRFLIKVVSINILSIFLPTTVICVLTLICFKLVVFRFNLDGSFPLYSLTTKALVFFIIYLIFMVLIDGRSFLKDFRFLWVHLRLKEEGLPEFNELENQTLISKL